MKDGQKLRVKRNNGEILIGTFVRENDEFLTIHTFSLPKFPEGTTVSIRKSLIETFNEVEGDDESKDSS